jgi:hypothetical protein
MNKTTQIRKREEYTFSGKDILELLSKAGIHYEGDARVVFTVPSGGDYSGDTLEIDESDPIRVIIESTYQE